MGQKRSFAEVNVGEEKNYTGSSDWEPEADGVDDALDTRQNHSPMLTLKLVCGKWSTDEEKYASELIFAFQCGTLDDCEEGTTLRSYLAKKLNCAPMRISKKFAGQGIGKMVYCTKFTNHCWTKDPTIPTPNLVLPGSTMEKDLSSDEEAQLWKSVLLYYCGENA